MSEDQPRGGQRPRPGAGQDKRCPSSSDKPRPASVSGAEGDATLTWSADSLNRLWSATITPGATPETTLRHRSRTPAAALEAHLNTRSVGTTDNPAAPSQDYTVGNVIGEGGAGVVYEATQTCVGRTVAFKTMRKTTSQSVLHRASFLREAVITSQLDHPGIVPIHELGIDQDGHVFYTMKRVQGTAWSETIREKSTDDNLEALLRVADAVAFAHDKGIIHRDVKPSNVMLGDFGEAYVVDWGLAVHIGEPSGEGPPDGGNGGALCAAKRSSAIHGIGGTPAYMPPEMAKCEATRICAQSDIYLLGAVLYEVLTGSPPHAGRTVLECLENAAANRIQPTDKSGDVMDIAYKAMATQPEDRYESVRDFQKLLREGEPIAHLEVLECEGLEVGTRLPLTVFNAIGRNPKAGNTMILPDLSISRRPHAIIRDNSRAGRGICIYNLIPHTRVEVNGEPATDPAGHSLHDGDEIRIRSVRLAFRQSEADPRPDGVAK